MGVLKVRDVDGWRSVCCGGSVVGAPTEAEVLLWDGGYATVATGAAPTYAMTVNAEAPLTGAGNEVAGWANTYEAYLYLGSADDGFTYPATVTVLVTGSVAEQDVFLARAGRDGDPLNGGGFAGRFPVDYVGTWQADDQHEAAAAWTVGEAAIFIVSEFPFTLHTVSVTYGGPGLFKLQDGSQWWQTCCGGAAAYGEWQPGVEAVADGPGPLWTDIIFNNGDTYTNALNLDDFGGGAYADGALYESFSPTGGRSALWGRADAGATAYSRNIACGMLPVYAAADGDPLPDELVAYVPAEPVGPAEEDWPEGAVGIEFAVEGPTMVEQRFRLTGYGSRGVDLPQTQVTPIFGRVLETPTMRPSVIQPSLVAYLFGFGSPTTPYVEFDRTVLPYSEPAPNPDYEYYGGPGLATDGYEMWSPWFSGDPGYSHYDPTEGVDLVFLTADIDEAGEVYDSSPWPRQTSFTPTFRTEVKYRSPAYRFVYSTSRPLKVRTEDGWVTATCLHGI